MNKPLEIDFYLLVGEDKIRTRDVLKTPHRLLNYYLAEEDPTDSTFQGGYGIVVDGKDGTEKKNFTLTSFPTL